MSVTESDHHLAMQLAADAGRLLLEVRDRCIEEERYIGAIRSVGDSEGHDFIADALLRHRPHDVLFSEEGADDPRRLEAPRVWIVDPLDGTSDYPNPHSGEWAVHVALVMNGRPVAGAVSLPVENHVLGTLQQTTGAPSARDKPLIISGRSRIGAGRVIAEALDGDLTACGSAGVKAMTVVRGVSDVYVHAGYLYEWDVCAPAAVAEAAGLHVSDIAGDTITYNSPEPTVPGLLISRPELAEAALEALHG